TARADSPSDHKESSAGPAAMVAAGSSASAYRESMGRMGGASCRGVWGWSSNRLENGGDALAGADAHGRQAELRLAVLHGVNERRGDAGAAGAERVADGDGAAAHVHLLRAQLQQLHHRQRLRRERLVDLDQVDVLQLQPGA